MFLREDQASIQVSVNNVAIPSLGYSWFSIEGGNLEADDGHTRPGGMGGEVSLGGPASRQDATCQIQLDDTMVNLHKDMEAAVKNSSVVSIQYVFLDRTGQKNRNAKTHTITGTLKAATLPDFTGDSGDPAMYEIVVSCDQIASSGS